LCDSNRLGLPGSGWWKILRALALVGRRFETWDEITDEIHRSTVYWDAHRYPFV
jgi:hypothetical protein